MTTEELSHENRHTNLCGSHRTDAYPRQQAAQFGVSCFRPDPTAELPLVRIPSRYKLWCEERGYAALPPDTIANELRGLFDKAGLMIEKRGNDLVVCGLALAE